MPRDEEAHRPHYQPYHGVVGPVGLGCQFHAVWETAPYGYRVRAKVWMLRPFTNADFYLLLGYSYLARLGDEAYFVLMDKRLAYARESRIRETQCSSGRVTMAAGLYAHDGALYLLTQKPDSKAKSAWCLHKIDPKENVILSAVAYNGVSHLRSNLWSRLGLYQHDTKWLVSGMEADNMSTLERPKPDRVRDVRSRTRRPPRKPASDSYELRNKSKPDLDPYTVFIIHSSEDSVLADMLAGRLEKAGGQVWLDDREIPGGESFRSKILEALGSCDEAVVLCSPNSSSSPWVFFEMGAICMQKKRLTPIMAHLPLESMPLISGLRAIDLEQLDRLFIPELKERIGAKELV